MSNETDILLLQELLAKTDAQIDYTNLAASLDAMSAPFFALPSLTGILAAWAGERTASF